MEHCLRLGRQRDPLSVPQHKGSQTSQIYLPQFKKPEEKTTVRNLTSSCWGQLLGQLIKLKIDKRAWEPKSNGEFLTRATIRLRGHKSVWLIRL